MNFYGLPEFISYSIIVGIACALIKQKKDTRLQYWLVGWVLILLHAGIFKLLPQRFPFDIVARGTLTVAGQIFILAAYYQAERTMSRPHLTWRVGLFGLLNLIFAVGSTGYAERHAADQHLGIFYVLVGLGAAATLWLAEADRAERRWGVRTSATLALLAYAIQAALLAIYGLTMASQWLMCWTYLAVAYFFLRQAPKPTLGVTFTALSFILWGLVFPVYSLLMIYAPTISRQIEAEVWNLPKFLAAASMILVLLEERVAEATLLATHDELTGLPNRRLYTDRFEQAVARAKRDGVGFGLLVIDLNRFKLLNDTLGHQAGDEVLRAVSSRFRSALRRVDTVARTGGDEFTVILEHTSSLREVETVRELLQVSLNEPINLPDGPYYASASIGAAIYPRDGSTHIALHAIADERMYFYKEQHRVGTERGKFAFDIPLTYNPSEE
jgi:diguanylate cyclase (GGDEF)-like protein